MNECRRLSPFSGNTANLTMAQRVGWNDQSDNNWRFQILPSALRDYSTLYNVSFYMTCESDQTDCWGRDCYDIHECLDETCDKW